MNKARPSHFPVVGLGGSAGGLRAFFELFEALGRIEQPPAMALVVVLHLPRDEDSHLPELLAHKTRLPVQVLEPRTEIAPNVVYVLPANRTLAAEDGALVLRERAAAGRHHPVDDLFRALATLFGERSVAVVCSGTGANGSSAVPLVREVGGCVIAQTPETAEFDEMPRHSIDTGAVDLVVPPAKMAEALVENARRLGRGARRPVGAAAEAPGDAASGDAASGDAVHGAPDDAEALRRILATLRTRTRLDFRQYKPGTLNRRLDRRMHLLGLDALEKYAEVLRDKPEEAEALAGDLLITVTGFFRDEAAWQVLEERVIAPLVARHPEDKPLRAWVAGCATGEEAYSLSIALFEAMRAQERRLPLEIFATDASHAALSRARGGVYPAASIQHLAPERQERWFRHEGDMVRVRPELREPMVFAPQDLIQDPPFSRADLVVCRNVLIYLQPEIQRRLVRLFHFALREGGCLFLGNSESIGDAAELFEAVDKPARIWARVGATRHDLVDFPVMRAQRTRREPEPPRPPERRPAPPVAGRALQALIDRHAPPSVLVDHASSVLYYHGATERFLRPQTGEATHSLLALARDGLAPHLRRAVEAARRSGAVETVPLRAALEDGPVPLRIEVAPVADGAEGGAEGGAFLVSFIADGPPVPAAGAAAAPASSLEQELDGEVRLLRAEIEALATGSSRAEEEFRAYNEEITSMNEELRAANEELETSKEELQSLNEELSTVNSQLRAKVDELRERTSDLNNLLSSTDVATLFLDEDLNVRWFSPRLEKLFHIRQADIQRPISHLVRQFADDALEADCRRVLSALAPVERQVETADRRSMLRRISPYRTVDDRIAGVVVNFSEVTALEQARHFAESVVETVPMPLLVLEADLRVRAANSSFYGTFGVERDATEGRQIFDLGDRQWDIPELRHLLGEVLPDDEVFKDFEVEHEFEQIGRKTMLLNARRLDNVQLILLAVEDVTERRRSEAHLTLLMAELAHRVKNSLAVVQGLASQTLRRSGSLEDFRTAFAGRLSAYARSHDQLLTRDWRQSDLFELVNAAVEAHAVDPDRIRAEGPAVQISPKQALALGLILHELETNATKYGALSTEAGHVDITWKLADDRQVALRWLEVGGPPVVPPGGDGFGSSLIRQLGRFDLGGTTELDYDASGLECRITFATAPPSEMRGEER